MAVSFEAFLTSLPLHILNTSIPTHFDPSHSSSLLHMSVYLLLFTCTLLGLWYQIYMTVIIFLLFLFPIHILDLLKTHVGSLNEEIGPFSLVKYFLVRGLFLCPQMSCCKYL